MTRWIRNKILVAFSGLFLALAALAQAQIYLAKEYGTQQGIARIDLDGSNGVNLVSTGERTRGLDVDTSGGHIYWTTWVTGGGAGVFRSNLDGSSSTTLISGLTFPQEVIADTANGKLYIALNFDELRSSNLDGSGYALLLDNGLDNEGLALDVPNQHLYYTTSDTFGSPGVYRVDFSGANNTTLRSETNSVDEVDLDLTNQKMYWTVGATGSIMRADLDGSNVETVASGLGSVRGISLDEASSHIYYAITDSVTPTNSSVNRINFDGTGNTTLITGGVAEGVRNIVVIPEPSTYALIVSLLALSVILLKRTRKKAIMPE